VPTRSRLLNGTSRVWLLTSLLAAAALWMYLTIHRGAPAPVVPLEVPWWALAIAFCLAEIFVVHIEIRREAYSYSLSEVPLLVGLFFMEPEHLILAQCVGASVALIAHRRQSPLKVAFNVSHLAVEAAVAGLVFTAIAGDASPERALAWAAAFAATSATALVADVSVFVAISLAEDRLDLRALLDGFAFSRAMQLTNTSLGLLAVELLWTSPAAVALLGVPMAAVLLAYRAYNRQRKRHEALQFLHDSTRALQEANDLDPAVHVVLSQARAMFRAEVAEIVYFAAGPEEPAVRWQLGPGDAVKNREEAKLRATEGVWARVAAEEQPLLFARPITNERLARHFGERGIRDAMVAPLKGDGGSGVVGLMLVGNRLSDIATFDEEDLELFTTLAHQADAALQNARLLTRLRQSLDELQEMNRLKDEFVGVVSHELRTPLTVISGAVKTVRRPEVELSVADRDGLLESAERAADRLRGLVEQLLSAARLEQAHTSRRRAPVRIAAIARAVASEADLRAGKPRLRVRMPEDLPLVHSDEGVIQRILGNLVDNALKYSGPDSVVAIDARIEGNEVIISVRDEGPGIPDEARERIFDRFFQGDSSTTRSSGGVGLGLYICRRLAEEIDARLWLVRSDERGSVFSLALETDHVPASVLSLT
jgi:signal transduction histidine kinase